MATQKQTASVIELTGIAADWSWTSAFKAASYPNGMRIGSIQFKPGQAADKLVIKDGSDTGPAIFDSVCTDSEEKNLYLNSYCKPVIDFSDCVLTGAHKVIIRLLPM